MSRLTEAWFRFKGILCEDMRVRLAQMPTREIAMEKGHRECVPGRNGSVWIPDGMDTHGDVGIVVECYTLDGASLDSIAVWLNGNGELIFSDEPNRAYRARIDEQLSRSSLLTMFSMQRFSLTFTCQPHRYLYPAAEAVELTEAGVIVNAGTASSAPRITIEGTGDMTVEIGGAQIGVTGGGVIVDSEMMDCFELDGVTLANSRVTLDDFPMIPSGECAVSWSGNVERVTVEGRWRYL